jgi:hypothetical protein
MYVCTGLAIGTCTGTGTDICMYRLGNRYMHRYRYRYRDVCMYMSSRAKVCKLLSGAQPQLSAVGRVWNPPELLESSPCQFMVSSPHDIAMGLWPPGCPCGWRCLLASRYTRHCTGQWLLWLAGWLVAVVAVVGWLLWLLWLAGCCGHPCNPHQFCHDPSYLS